MFKKIIKHNNLGQKYVTLLRISVISSSITSLLAGIRNFITHNIQFYITTLNPELILMAQGDQDLLKAVNNSDLPIPDGVGLKYATRFLYNKELKIIPGRKLFISLIELANKKAWRVFFLGGEGDEARLAASKLELNYKKVKIETAPGPKLNEGGGPVTEIDKKIEKDAIDKINKFKPQILFVAFGMPKQEKWIAKWLPTLKIGGAMTVGGTFRYFAGLAKLPPKWMEKDGLEWFWRLITEPWRAKRILNAVIIFPLKIFWYKVSHL